jgi:cobalt-zinc-cadmium efflux system membrane fusion protein
VGDAVNKGDELVVVESPELGRVQSEFLQARTAVSVAQTQVEPAVKAHERAKALYEKNQGIALAEVQKREAEARAAEGELATAKAALSAHENGLRLLGMSREAVEAMATSGEISPRYVITAPIAGQVVEREVTLGELVSPEKDALLVLADLSDLWVLADVPEARLADVAVGASARVQVEAASKKALDGKVAYVSPSLDPNTRTGRVRIVVPAQNGGLRPGMFARVELSAATVDGVEQSLTVPDEAVQTVDGQPTVFVPVVGEPNTFAPKPVKVGRVAGGLVPILEGLAEGDHVVTSGTFILKADLAKAGAAHEH